MERKPRDSARAPLEEDSPLLVALASHSSPSRPPRWRRAGGEANLILPDLNQVSFHGIAGGSLLALGLIICALGLASVS